MNAQTQASKERLAQSLERRHNASTSLAALWRPAPLQAFVKLDPRQSLRSPVMLVVELTAGSPPCCASSPTRRCRPRWRCRSPSGCGSPCSSPVSPARSPRGVARPARTVSRPAARASPPISGAPTAGSESVVASSLRKGDVVRVQAGEMIPGDGEVIEGVAAVNEGRHHRRIGAGDPRVRRRSLGGDRQHGGGGPDWLLVRIGANPGESTLDRMIALVEGAKRQKTPNEVALDILADRPDPDLPAGSGDPQAVRPCSPAATCRWCSRWRCW